MTKFAGQVSYVTQVESSPGVWTDEVNSRHMRGDILRINSTMKDSGKINGNISLNHRVSLIGDAYSLGNYYDMKYINLDGRDWEIDSVEVQHPRIIVTLGGVWHGE